MHPCDFFFFFNDTATTEIYTLSLHDALPILSRKLSIPRDTLVNIPGCGEEKINAAWSCGGPQRSEEHTSELQSHLNLVCRLLLEKKKKNTSSCDSDLRPRRRLYIDESWTAMC